VATSSIGILAASVALPRRRIAAGELAANLRLDPVAVREKLGLVEKCIALDDDEHPSQLCARAATSALAALGASADDVGLVVFCGVSRDYLGSFSVALEVAAIAGFSRALAYDVMLGCAAPLVAIEQARNRSDDRPPLTIVCSAERWSDTLSPDVPFPLAWAAHADGGGALVVGGSRGTGPRAEVHYASFAMNASFNRFLVVPAGGTREPASQETIANHRHARRVLSEPDVDVGAAYVEGYINAVARALANAGARIDEIDVVIMNQIRPELRRRVQQAIGVGADKCIDTYPRIGHLGGADMMIGIVDAVRAGRLRAGSRALLAASSVSAIGAAVVDVGVAPVVAPDSGLSA
jgi:3-oxoacyl-[acyl-carrier-protein] synthase-3